MPVASPLLPFRHYLWPVGLCLPRVELPLILSPRPQAGFPSPAADYVEERVDLNEYLIRNAPATFCARIKGDSMRDEYLREGDVVMVDRSISPRPGMIVVAVYDGDIYIKVLDKVDGRLALCSRNESRALEYPPLYLDESQEHTIWGVVTGAVRKF